MYSDSVHPETSLVKDPGAYNQQLRCQRSAKAQCNGDKSREVISMIVAESAASRTHCWRSLRARLRIARHTACLLRIFSQFCIRLRNRLCLGNEFFNTI